MRIKVLTKFSFICFIVFITSCSSQIIHQSTSTPQPTNTPQPTITLTPKTYKVTFISFHDFNGNGTQDDGEPLLEGILNRISSGECTTGIDGKCSIINIPAGNYDVSILTSPLYKYLTPNIHEDIPLSEGLGISVNRNIIVQEPIVEGPYRSPFRNLKEITVSQWVDLDKESCLGGIPDRTCSYRLDWLGGKNVYDGHQGFDIELNNDQIEIYAMREGSVSRARFLGEKDGWEININDKNPYSHGGDSYQMLVHMDEIFVSLGQDVDSTTLIGKGGHGSTSTLHIGIYTDVSPFVDPLDGDWRISPHADRVKCPFADRMWTSFNIFGTINEQRNNIGKSQRVVFP